MLCNAFLEAQCSCKYHQNKANLSHGKQDHSVVEQNEAMQKVKFYFVKKKDLAKKTPFTLKTSLLD